MNYLLTVDFIEERFWQEYVEPAESSMSASIMQGMDDPMVVPLEQVREIRDYIDRDRDIKRRYT